MSKLSANYHSGSQGFCIICSSGEGAITEDGRSTDEVFQRFATWVAKAIRGPLTDTELLKYKESKES